MIKTPVAGRVGAALVTVLAMAGILSSAAPAAAARRATPAGGAASAGAPVFLSSGEAAPWTDSPPPEDRSHSTLDFGGAGAKPADLPLDAVTGEGATALPLSKFLTGDTRIAAARGPFGLWDFLNRVRYGGLPEPASWALILIGFGMIGGALRGFVVASRRLAGLQPDAVDVIDEVD